MALFFNRKRTIEHDKAFDKKSSDQVIALKKKTHLTATQANKDIKKVNDLLIKNGITFRIHIATGGHHG